MGLSARAICIKHGIEFSTSFHTRFPEYVHARFPLRAGKLVWRLALVSQPGHRHDGGTAS